jgi:hypothetical protein
MYQVSEVAITTRRKSVNRSLFSKAAANARLAGSVIVIIDRLAWWWLWSS